MIAKSDGVDWLREKGQWLFSTAVEVYSWGFGEKNAQLVVGSVALLLLGVITLMTAFHVFREMGAIGVKLMKLILLAALALFLGSLMPPLYSFVFPDEQSRQQAQEAASTLVNETSSWALSTLWQRVVRG